MERGKTSIAWWLDQWLLISIDIYWYLLISIDIYWYLLISIDIYWHLLISIDIYWYLLISIDIYWHLLISIDIYWYLLISIDMLVVPATGCLLLRVPWNLHNPFISIRTTIQRSGSKQLLWRPATWLGSLLPKPCSIKSKSIYPLVI